jgi:integrase
MHTTLRFCCVHFSFHIARLFAWQIFEGEKPMPTKRKRGYGQVIERGKNTYLIRVPLGKDAEGKRKFYNHTIKGTKLDAERHLHEYLHKKSLGIAIEPARATFKEFLEEWFENICKQRVRQNTFAHYRYQIERYAYPVIGSMRLQSVSTLTLEKFYNSILKTPGSKEQGKINAEGIRYLNTVIKSAFQHAVKCNLVVKNPAIGVTLPRRPHREMRAMNPEEARRFLETVKSHRWGIVYKFALITGMRPEEYMGLKWQDLNLSAENNQSYLSVRRALVWHRGGGWTIEEPKTLKSRRMLPLSDSLASELMNHRASQELARQKWGDKWKGGEWVFTCQDGRPLNLRKLAHFYKELLVKAGLPREMRLYDLRHSCATLLLVQGINPKIVSERLGHSSVVLTLDTYSHVLPTMQHTANDALDEVLKVAGSSFNAPSVSSETQVILNPYEAKAVSQDDSSAESIH